MLKKLLNEIIANTDFTQKEIAEYCDVSESKISKMQNGSNIDYDTLRKIAKYCNADTELLITTKWFEDIPKEIEKKFDILIDNLYMLSSLEISENISQEELLKAIELYKKESKAKVFLDLLNQNFEIYKQNNEMTMKEEGYIANFYNIKNKQFQIKDDYMSPRISRNSYINLIIDTKLKNGDIIYFKYNEKKYCRAFLKITENRYFLYSFQGNSNFIIDLKNPKDFEILGKVESVTTEI